MNERHVYVIGDLHLGAGVGDCLEDFHFDQLFVTWLAEIAPMAPTLVVNGDFIDFPQIPPFDLSNVPRALLWDEATSLVKLNGALAAHAAVFDALRAFIDDGGSLTITVGNHDLDLAWPKVQEVLRQRLGQPTNRFSIKIGAYREQGLFVQHGYQFTPENCPVDPNRFIHDTNVSGVTHQYLERVWGTDFVLRFYNGVEREWPFIDNVKPTLRVLMAGLREGWIPVAELARFAVFVKVGLPLRAVGSFLSEHTPPDEMLLQAFADAEWQELVNELRTTRGAEVEAAVEALPPEDLEVLRQTEPATIDVEMHTAEADPTLGLFRAGNREERAARKVLKKSGAQIVVFGHTHRMVDGNLAGAPVPQLFNPGSWVAKLRLDDPDIAAQVTKRRLVPTILTDPTLYRLDAYAVHAVVSDRGVQASLEEISARHPELSIVPDRKC